jgi:hypothetical protein
MGTCGTGHATDVVTVQACEADEVRHPSGLSPRILTCPPGASQLVWARSCTRGLDEVGQIPRPFRQDADEDVKTLQIDGPASTKSRTRAPN